MLFLLNGVTFYVFVFYVFEISDKLVSYFVPSVIALSATLIVIQIFLGYFDDAVVSMMCCLAIDKEMHNGKPCYGPQKLHQKLKKIT